MNRTAGKTPQPHLVKLGKFIAEAIASAGYTPYRFGREFEISKSSLNDAINGIHEPNTKNLRKIAEGLNRIGCSTSIDALLSLISASEMSDDISDRSKQGKVKNMKDLNAYESLSSLLQDVEREHGFAAIVQQCARFSSPSRQGVLRAIIDGSERPLTGECSDIAVAVRELTGSKGVTADYVRRLAGYKSNGYDVGDRTEQPNGKN